MIPFPSIHHLKDVPINMRYVSSDLPASLRFVGTVKLHGTHADVVVNREGIVTFQSRNRIITPGDDNCGFATAMIRRAALFAKLAEKGDTVFAGEWCGRGVQSGVGIAALDRFFVIYAVRELDTGQERWLDVPTTSLSTNLLAELNAARVFFIDQFPRFEVTVARDDVLASVTVAEVDRLTLAVERECPVARYFGVVGGVGEGIVWKCADAPTSRMWFKSKGPLHAVVRPAKIAKGPTDDNTFALSFVDACVPEARFRQGLDHLREYGLDASTSNMGAFIKWVCDDAIKEEGSDLTPLQAKAVRKLIAQRGSKFYCAQK